MQYQIREFYSKVIQEGEKSEVKWRVTGKWINKGNSANWKEVEWDNKNSGSVFEYLLWHILTVYLTTIRK